MRLHVFCACAILVALPFTTVGSLALATVRRRRPVSAPLGPAYAFGSHVDCGQDQKNRPMPGAFHEEEELSIMPAARTRGDGDGLPDCVGARGLRAVARRRAPGIHPEQPIAFSHKLHAGDSRIPCLYCHFGAR